MFPATVLIFLYKIINLHVIGCVTFSRAVCYVLFLFLFQQQCGLLIIRVIIFVLYCITFLFSCLNANLFALLSSKANGANNSFKRMSVRQQQHSLVSPK